MKLYLLEPNRKTIPNLLEDDNPFYHWYRGGEDAERVTFTRFIISAPTEMVARQLANGEEGLENESIMDEQGNYLRPWLDPKFSKCEEIGESGKYLKEEVVFSNYQTGDGE